MDNKKRRALERAGWKIGDFQEFLELSDSEIALMDMKIEQGKEGWVEFTRYPCREGFIDVYTGDSGHNPNTGRRPRYQLNAIKSWLRLNGEGPWVEPRHMYSVADGQYSLDDEVRADHSATEIFEAIMEEG